MTRQPLLGFSSGIFLCLSITATGLVAAPNDAAGPRAPSDVAPPASSLVGVAPAGLADWRLQMAGRIDRNKTFPADVYCREGVVTVTFLIDRAGNLRSSEIAESSSIPAFGVEALAILKRAHPFPPPPEGVGGAFVSLRVPMRFIPAPEGEKRLYLNLKSDLTLTLDGVAVERKELERTIISTTNNDRKAWINICSDENVPPEQLSNLAEQVKAADFNFTVIPRPDPKSR